MTRITRPPIDYNERAAAAFEGHGAGRVVCITVVTVEPSAAMRARSACPTVIGGDALALPFGPATMDAAWLSTVVHHLPDLPAAAREAATTDTRPVIDSLDLLVLHNAEP